MESRRIYIREEERRKKSWKKFFNTQNSTMYFTFEVSFHPREDGDTKLVPAQLRAGIVGKLLASTSKTFLLC